jgi:hypothetical protein
MSVVVRCWQANVETTTVAGTLGLILMAIPPSHSNNDHEAWSEKDLLVLYSALSLGSSIQEIAARLNRNVEEVREKVASLKEQPKKE